MQIALIVVLLAIAALLILYYTCLKNNAFDKMEVLARSSIGSDGFDFTNVSKRTLTNKLKTRVVDMDIKNESSVCELP